MWPAPLRRLAPGYSTYLPDLPGHGRSSGMGRFSVDAYAEVVVEFIRGLDLTAVVLVGHSLGGAVALSVALRHPELCRKLVLFNSAARFLVPAALLAALEAGQEQAIAAVCRYVCVPSVPVRLTEVTRKMLAEVSLETLRADYTACRLFDVRERVSEIAAPTLVVGADGDLLTPPQDQRWLAARLARAQLVMLEDCGHMAVLTNASDCRKVLLKFLET